jgi:hypothetical protein
MCLDTLADEVASVLNVSKGAVLASIVSVLSVAFTVSTEEVSSGQWEDGAAPGVPIAADTVTLAKGASKTLKPFGATGRYLWASDDPGFFITVGTTTAANGNAGGQVHVSVAGIIGSNADYEAVVGVGAPIHIPAFGPADGVTVVITNLTDAVNGMDLSVSFTGTTRLDPSASGGRTQYAPDALGSARRPGMTVADVGPAVAAVLEAAAASSDISAGGGRGRGGAGGGGGLRGLASAVRSVATSEQAQEAVTAAVQTTRVRRDLRDAQANSGGDEMLPAGFRRDRKNRRTRMGGRSSGWDARRGSVS